MRARTLTLLVLALGGLVLLGGCLKRTNISETYVLEPVAAGNAASPSQTPEAVDGVLKVTVPGWIDRPQLNGRSSTGQILTDEFARWGEPIAKGVQRVVAENLAALLPTRRVVAAPFSPNQVVDQRVDITLSEAARRADGSVLVEARWALLGPRGATLVQRRSSHRANPTAAGAAGAVTGASDALGALSGAFVRLEVIDSGPGVDRDERERIFESFYQGKAPPGGRVKGSGLGLAIARDYALAHGGRIEVRDRPDGERGACFRLTLPLASSAVAPTVQGPPTTLPVASGK